MNRAENLASEQRGSYPESKDFGGGSPSVLGKRPKSFQYVGNPLENFFLGSANKTAPVPPASGSEGLTNDERMRFNMAETAFRPIWPYLEGGRGQQIRERFWDKVAKAGPDQCWDWTAALNHHGYGRFKIASYATVHANRVAWVIHNERDTDGLLVRHRCDRPMCCNPAHLELGTPADNNMDMVERGRCSQRPMYGEHNGASRLTTAQIGEIVAALRSGRANTSIARRYPVGHALISRIRTGRSWQREAAQFGWQPAIDYLARLSSPSPVCSRGVL